MATVAGVAYLPVAVHKLLVDMGLVALRAEHRRPAPPHTLPSPPESVLTMQ